MDTIHRTRCNAPPQRRTMYAGWADMNLYKKWTSILRLTAKSWKVEAAALRLKLPSGAWALGRVGLDTPVMDQVEAMEEGFDGPWTFVPDLDQADGWVPLKEKGWRSLAAIAITDEAGAAGSL